MQKWCSLKEQSKKDKETKLKSWDKHDAEDGVEQKDQTMLDSTRIAGEKEDGHIKVKLCIKECQEDMDTGPDLLIIVKDAEKIFMTNAANEKFEKKNSDITIIVSQGSSLEQD